MTAHIFNCCTINVHCLTDKKKLIFVPVIYKMESLYGTNSIVVTEENKDNGYIFKFFF